MAMPTSMELSILAQFQNKLSDLCFNNAEEDEDTQMFLMRFLRARNHNLSKAEDMLRKHMEWRKANRIDSLLQWTPPQFIVEDCHCQFDVAGFDKQGCPIVIVPFGIWDVRKVCEKGLKREYVQYVDQLFQYAFQAMKESSRKRGTPITQFICIMLADEFHALRQMSSPQAVESVLETVRRFEANFPETLKRGFILDFPAAFNIILNMVTPLLNSATIDKVMLSSNEKEYKTALLGLVDEDQLCIRLGGTRRSKMPILNGERGEYKYQLQSKTIPGGFLEVTIGAGEMFKLHNHIENEESQISWAFKTVSNDIGFSLIGPDLEELVPYSRVTSNEEPQEARITCLEPGKYTIIFDNSFSRFRSKVLCYKVVVEDSNSSRSRESKIVSVVGESETDSSNGIENSSENNGEVESSSL